MQHATAKTGLNGGEHYGLSGNSLIDRSRRTMARITDHDIAGRTLALLGTIPILESASPLELGKHHITLVCRAHEAKT